MRPNKITVHCAATPNGKNFTTKQIRKWHLDRGWRDIGYHSVVEIDGSVNKGRDENTVGAHVGGHNYGNLGVCLVGDTKFTRKQFESLKIRVTSWMNKYSIDKKDVGCHYEYGTAKRQGKSCPNILKEDLHLYLFENNIQAIEKYILKKGE